MHGVQGKFISYLVINNSCDSQIESRYVTDATVEVNSQGEPSAQELKSTAWLCSDPVDSKPEDTGPEDNAFDFTKERVGLKPDLCVMSGIFDRAEDIENSLEKTQNINFKHFEDPGRVIEFIPQDDIESVSRSALSSDSTINKSESSGSGFSEDPCALGTTKIIYVPEIKTDGDKQYYNYRRELTFTLRAKGYNDGSLVCYVWVPDSYWAESDADAKKTKINMDMAQSIAGTFAKYRNAETALIGSESDSIIYSSDGKTGKTMPMSDISSTGNIINIVVYDIDFDWTENINCGTVGFFTRKDYWTFSDTSKIPEAKRNYLSSTNCGKYFYIDSAFCNLNLSSSSRWEGNTEVSDTVVTTLFHEYQHMINYSIKEIEKRAGITDAWFDEMCSMLVEDCMQDIIECDSGNVPAKVRLPLFNRYYYKLGADSWTADPEVLNYASSYAFGAYLTRNYGGARLVSSLVQNSYIDWESVINAVKTVTGTVVTKEKLLEDFAMASSYRPSYAEAMNLPTFYKSPSDYYAGKYNYSLKPLNIFSSEYKFTESCINADSSTTEKNYYGPVMLKTQSMTLEPGGFAHMGVCNVPEDKETVTLTLSGISCNKDEKIFILVHEAENFSKADEYGG